SRSGAGPDPGSSFEPCRTGEGQPPAGTTPALPGGLRLAPERHAEAADRPNRGAEPPDRDPLALLGELSRAPGAAAGGQHLSAVLRLPGAALLRWLPQCGQALARDPGSGLCGWRDSGARLRPRATEGPAEARWAAHPAAVRTQSRLVARGW